MARRIISLGMSFELHHHFLAERKKKCMSHDLFTWPDMTWGSKKGEKCDHLVVTHTGSSHSSSSPSLGFTSRSKPCAAFNLMWSVGSGTRTCRESTAALYLILKTPCCLQQGNCTKKPLALSHRDALYPV